MRIGLSLGAWLLVALSWPAMAGADAERESFDLRVPVAPAPVPTQGRARLFHELHLTNFAREALVPERVQVQAADGTVLADYAGEALRQRMVPLVPVDGPGNADVIAPGAVRVLHVELDLAPEAVPPALRHVVTYGAHGAESRSRVTGGAVAVDTSGIPVLGPPLRGGPWAAVFDPAWARGHRRVFYAVDGRAVLPGRLALDLVKLDAQGHIAARDPDLIRHAYGYAEPVLAVADAEVVAARGDYPEAERISANGRHPLSAGSGNYVVLALGDGRHVFYEHLRPRSVRVAVGQRVRRGQVLGEVGLSGSGGWPHLHLHVADGPSLLGAEGRPFAFEGFVLLGRYADFSQLGRAPWQPDSTGPRSGERPPDNAVLRFPD
ncbi:M23 family metallopeptidase [Luteimonas sp. SDU101]|uniref:M23 family metallopeptidase n=1 Tax=Luteimonas sp. SDU101 TaxID=3422593 RepID=UPI003EB87164